MPYIKTDRRKDLDNGDFPGTPGELNYVFTKAIIAYLLYNDGGTATGISYQSINDIIGALEGAKLEFYRRLAAPYEDLKMRENGDVY